MADCCFSDNHVEDWEGILRGARCDKHNCRKEALNQARFRAIAYLEERGVSANGGAAMKAVKKAVEHGLVDQELLPAAICALKVRNALMYHQRDRVSQEEVLESVTALRDICDASSTKEHKSGPESQLGHGDEFAAMLVVALLANADQVSARLAMAVPLAIGAAVGSVALAADVVHAGLETAVWAAGAMASFVNKVLMFFLAVAVLGLVVVIAATWTEHPDGKPQGAKGGTTTQSSTAANALISASQVETIPAPCQYLGKDCIDHSQVGWIRNCASGALAGIRLRNHCVSPVKVEVCFAMTTTSPNCMTRVLAAGAIEVVKSACLTCGRAKFEALAPDASPECVTAMDTFAKAVRCE